MNCPESLELRGGTCRFGAGLKWVDSFRAFWQDGWNVFDFLITFLTLLPELLALLPATSDGGALDSGLPKLGAQTATHT